MVSVLGHVYVRTMCTLEHTAEARVVAITRRSGTARCTLRDRAAKRLFLNARSSTSRQLREVRSTHGRSARSRTRRLSRRRSRGATYSRLRRPSLFSPRPGSAGSAPRVRVDVRCSRGASCSASRQQASNAARLLSSAMCLHHVYTRPRSAAYAPLRVAPGRGATRRTRSSRRATLLVCAGSGVATAARGRIPAWEKSALARSSIVASAFPRRYAPSSSSSVAPPSARR